jgi:uncharacterized protein (TIGR02421 family)
MKTPQAIDSDFCQQVVDRLARGEVLHCDLPGGGCLHFDRQLPFLCVYRLQAGRKDPGTAELLTSQAAYLVVSESEVETHDIGRLTETVVQAMARQFGAFLLLEIWTGGTGENDAEEDQKTQSTFHLLAHTTTSPTALLEAMEAALLRIRVEHEPPVIRLDYGTTILPIGKKPLLPGYDPAVSNIECLGLEINPFFRDPQTGDLYVFAYKKFRERFNRALKRCFYEFVRLYTTHRPAHYHELGPQAVGDTAVMVDEQLAQISEAFDLLLYVSPVNYPEAWEAFQGNGCSEPVQFLYRPRTIDPDLLKRRLYDIPIENVEDPTLFHIFNAKRIELDRQITLLSDRNTPRFLLGSRQLFGDVSPELLQTATFILQQVAPASEIPSKAEIIDAMQFARHAQQEVEYYRQQDQSLQARVEVRDDIPGIMVSHGNFLIGSSAQVSRSRLNATLAHEIGTHVVTYHNGKQQPFRELYVGMAGYEPMQEGLAVLSEYLVGELGSARLRQLAGRVVAVRSVTDGADFMETFRLLHHDYGFGSKAAFMMTMRTHRGGGYTKDAVYLKGLVSLLDRLGSGKQLESMYLGKIALEYLALVEELNWRQVLEKAPLVPRLFSLPDAQQRIARLGRGMTVPELLQEAI